MQSNTLDQILTKRQVAIYLQSSQATIDRLRRSGQLKSIRVGGRVMFKQSEIVRFIEEEA